MTGLGIGVLGVCLATVGWAGVGWQDEAVRGTLRNDALVARLQGGFLYELTTADATRKLVNLAPGELAAVRRVFDTTSLDLGAADVVLADNAGRLDYTLTWADGTTLRLNWRIEGADLVLRASARTPSAVGTFAYTLQGCDIADHSVVWVSNFGASHAERAPWTGSLGDVHHGFSRGFVHPLVALFEGEGAGWFMEGREEKIGPANILLQGRGATVDATLVRGFPAATTAPELFEIRLRAYREHWADAVDPYVKWMEHGAGFVPLEKKSPAWIKDIQVQAYVRVGDFDGLESLARRVDPARTMIGRMVGWRVHPMDLGYPDYRVNETAKRWIRRARELGFHVGTHFNTAGVSKNNAELLQRFERGFAVIGTDAQGNKQYYEIDGAGRHRYCSTALKDWRDYLIAQMREAVEVGVDLIYIDESMAATGAFIVDGMTAIEGLMTLEKEILEAYPQVAVETEQFNPMANRHAAFTLSQMPLGHPLSGYIFHRFVKILPEGLMSSPTGGEMLDAFQSWGFLVPGGGLEESWLQIRRAFQDHDLVPDVRLPRRPFRRFAKHPSHGVAPVPDGKPTPAGGVKLFGYRGKGGTTAFYEKHPNRRGLVVYEPGKEPQWVGARITGVTTWTSPGVVYEVSPGVDRIADWMVYDGDTILGLDPKKTYGLDEHKTLDQDRFHLTAIPGDFALQDHDALRIVPVHQGVDGSFYKLTFTGNGEISMVVPDDMLVFLNGEQVPVDRASRSARASIAATTDDYGVLIAFRKSDVELSGPWADLPWQTSRLQRSFYCGQHQILDYSTEGPVRKLRDINAFYTHVTGTGVMIGKLPATGNIRLQGAYGMREESIITDGDGVVRINGKDVMRIPAGPRPYKVHAFDVDITPYAGQHVMLEFVADGRVHGPTAADWYNPWIAVDPRHETNTLDQLKILM